MTKKEMRLKIEDEITVDAYDEDEIMAGWFTFFQDELSFPFVAKAEIKYKSTGKKLTKVKVLDVNLQSGNFNEAIIVFEVNPEGMDIVFEIPINKIKNVADEDGIKEAFALWDFWNS